MSLTVATAPSRAQWDRATCRELTCCCHDDSAVPYTCSSCGCQPDHAPHPYDRQVAAFVAATRRYKAHTREITRQTQAAAVAFSDLALMRVHMSESQLERARAIIRANGETR